MRPRVHLFPSHDQAYLALTVGGSVPNMAASNPGAQRILLGAFGLPMGLFMTLVGGGELFTVSAGC